MSVLEERNISYIDFGTFVNKDCDYNDYVLQATNAIASKQCDFGVGFCKTGQGVNILANHCKNIRAALVTDPYSAEYAIRHNCANFFSVPSRLIDKETFGKMVDVWKITTFDGGRHMTRMKKIVKPNDCFKNE
jgi:ribose 5-phosphate isomerase B